MSKEHKNKFWLNDTLFCAATRFQVDQPRVAREVTNSSGSPVRVARRHIEAPFESSSTRCFTTRDRQRFIQLHNVYNALHESHALKRGHSALRPTKRSSTPEAHDRQAGCRALSGGCCHRHYCAPLRRAKASGLFYQTTRSRTRPARTAAIAP